MAHRVLAGVLGGWLAAALAPAAAAAAECTPVPLWDEGRAQAPVCAERAAAAGLTVIDLSSPPPAHMGDEQRARCHDAVDDRPLARVRGVVYPGTPVARGRAVGVAQAHLRCEGLLDPAARPGVFDRRTAEGLRAYQRQQAIEPSGRLDGPTRAALLGDPGELDLRGALRELRQRVALAAGLIEDGSAAAAAHPVLARLLEPAGRAGRPVTGGAPDLIGRATDETARALGWTSSARVACFFAAAPGRVAVRLPPAPGYHATHMDLRAEIRAGTPTRRPALVLWAARDVGGEIALVRWPLATHGWRRPSRAWRGCGPVAQSWSEVTAGEVALRAGCRDLPAPQAARLAAFLLEHRLYLPHLAGGTARYELVPPVPVAARAPGRPSVVEDAHASARALPDGHLAGRAGVDPRRNGRGQPVGLSPAHPASL